MAAVQTGRRVDDTASTLLLDFGGVISRTPFETHREAERMLGLPPGSLKWLGPFDPEGDSLWAAMQRDEITERDYWAIRARETGELLGETGWNAQTFLNRSRVKADPAQVLRPEALSLIDAAIKQGRRVAVLSNELELFYGPEWVGELPVLGRMDAVIDLSFEPVLKPDRAAFQLAIDRLGVEPGEVVFVDDQPRNIAGARAAGLQTVCFDVREPTESFEVAARLLAVSWAGVLDKAHGEG